MLVHIVAGVPPAINGVGDYCYKLWQYWPSPRSHWHILTLNVSPESYQVWPEVSISKITRDTASLLRALDEVNATEVVLHYSGYGFHPKSCATWLSNALKIWKQRPGRTLIVMFHEVYFRGKITHSSFWLAPIARHVAVQLVKSCDRWITSCTDYQTQLEGFAPEKAHKGTLIPIGANILPSAEVDFLKPWPLSNGKKLKICIFGQPNTRVWTLNAHWKLLKFLCEKDVVESILVLGRPEQPPTSDLGPIIANVGFAHLWKREYGLSTEDLSTALLQQDLGLIHNWPGNLTKSGVYAAFVAHGILTVAVEKATPIAVPVPCFESNDARPEDCLKTLQCSELVDTKKHELRDAHCGTLSWEAIARTWQGLS